MQSSDWPAALSLIAFLLFTEFAAVCFRRLARFMEAGIRALSGDTHKRIPWRRVALLGWAFGGTIPLLTFSLSCLIFLEKSDYQLAHDFVLGATIGSNIVALGLLFGLILYSSQLTFFRIRTMSSPVALFIGTVAFTFTALNGTIGFFEGVILWLMALAYAMYFRSFSTEWKYYQIQQQEDVPTTSTSFLSSIAVLCMGFGFFIGAIVTAYPVILWIARFGARNEYSSVLLGVHFLALLLTLPWLIRVLFTLGASSSQKAANISSITHTCMLNMLFLPGLLALFRDLNMNLSFIAVDLPVLLFFTGTFVATLLIEKQQGRALPALILAAYFVYIGSGVLR